MSHLTVNACWDI